MVKAIFVHEYGGPEVLKIGTYTPDTPSKTAVKIKHTAIGVNYIDTYYRTGLYPTTLPFIPGEEAVGVIEEIGSDVKQLKVGDRVAYATISLGAYSESRVIDSNSVIPIPEELPDIKIAASLTRGLTAEYLLFRSHDLQAGQTILVHAAAGGVGSIICQWAKNMGAIVYGTVGDSSKIKIAKKYGCDDVIVHSEESVSEIVRDKTKGELLDVVYDGIGCATLKESIRCVKPRGLLVSFGNASGAPEPIDVLELSRQGSIFLTRPRLSDYTNTRIELMAAAKKYFDALIDNQVKLSNIVTIPLEEAYKAHEILQDRKEQAFPVLIP